MQISAQENKDLKKTELGTYCVVSSTYLIYHCLLLYMLSIVLSSESMQALLGVTFV